MVYKAMRQAIAPLIPRIYQLPFNQELARGTLPRQKFNEFLRQDRLYLGEFSHVLKKISHRFSDSKNKTLFLELSNYISETELQLHHKYLSDFSDREQSTGEIQAFPSTADYIEYLHQTATDDHLAVAASSCLPCFCLYSELGIILPQQKQQEHQYSSWIRSYSSKQFLMFTEKIITATNELANQADSSQFDMIRAFTKSTHHELSFLESFSPTSAYTPGLFKPTVITATEDIFSESYTMR